VKNTHLSPFVVDMEQIHEEELRQLAAAGNAQAMYELGRWNIHGPYESRNREEAFRLTQQAVELGHVEAISQLGSCYAHGIGVACDPDKAVALYQQAVAQDVTEARYFLGSAWYHGWGVPRDRKKAAELLKSAVERGCSPAKVLLACCYLTGEGIRKNKRKGNKLLKEAEETADSPRTYLELGNALWVGKGIKHNAAKAFEWYQRAANDGVAWAWVQIAWFYLTGSVVCCDLNKAVEILHRPEVAGLPGTEFLLAYCYHCGVGVERDVDEAIRLYNSAVEKGTAYIQYEWGTILDSGEYAAFGIPQDRGAADKWLNIVAKKDYVWTRKQETDWRLATWAAFCLYWWIIPCFAVIIIARLISPNDLKIKSLKDAFHLLELCGYLLPSFVFYFVGAFGNLRCARWGSVWMFFASLDMAVFVMLELIWKESPAIFGVAAIVIVVLLLGTLATCKQFAERTRWQERKFHERRISFKPTVILAATVFCLVQVLRFVLS